MLIVLFGANPSSLVEAVKAHQPINEASSKTLQTKALEEDATILKNTKMKMLKE